MRCESQRTWVTTHARVARRMCLVCATLQPVSLEAMFGRLTASGNPNNSVENQVPTCRFPYGKLG